MDFTARLGTHPIIGLDTEADSLHSYHEKICLVQISSPDGCFLVDPLADGLDLAPFYASLTHRTLVIHGADYDLRMLGRHPSFEASDIFDTTIAARLLGIEQFGYAALVQKFFNVTLSKSSQRADWGRRPLSAQMTEYALNDVRYLLQLAKILEEQLHALGRWEWFRQSRDAMVRSTREPRERDMENIWRINGSSKLTPRENAVLRALWHWRDAEASTWDRPPFHVMSNERLLNASRDAVVGKKIEVHRMPSSRYGRMKAALSAALALPESEWPVFLRERKARPSNTASRRFDQLREKRDAIARDLALDPSLIASRTTLMSVAMENGVRLLPWQQALLQVDEPVHP